MNNKKFTTEEMLTQALEKIKEQEKQIATLKSNQETDQSPNNASNTKNEVLPEYTKGSNVDDINLELLIGKYWIQIIGVITFLVGMSLFLKYSIERGWLTPVIRTIMSFIAATGLVFSGEMWRKKFAGWTNTLVAGGIILYYFTFHAAFTWYKLLAMQSTFFAFCAVSLLSIMLAIRRDSTLLMAITLFFSFLTPLISGIITINSQQTFWYHIILAILFFVISYTKEWLWLSLGSIFFSYFSVSFFGSFFTFILSGSILFFPILVAHNSNQNLAFSIILTIIYIVVPYTLTLKNKVADRSFEACIISLSWLILLIADCELIASMNPGDIGYQLKNFIIMKIGSHHIPTFLLFFFGTLFLIQYSILFLTNRYNKYLLPTLSSLFTLNIGAAIAHYFWGSSYYWKLSYHLDLYAVFALNLFGLLLLIIGHLLSTFHIQLCAYATLYGSLVHIFLSAENDWNPSNTHYTTLRLFIIISSFLIAVGLEYFFKKQKQLDSDLAITIKKRIPSYLISTVIMILFYWLHTAAWNFPYSIFGIILYALLLFIAGIFTHRRLRLFAYAFGSVGLIHFFVQYHSRKLLFNPDYFFTLNMLYGLFLGTVVIIYFLVSRFKERFEQKEQQALFYSSRFLIGLITIIWGWANLAINYLHTHELYSNQLLSCPLHVKRFIDLVLAGTCGLYSLVVILIGLFKKQYLSRYLGLALLAVTVIQILFILGEMSDSVIKFTSFIITGLLLVVISVGYQQLSNQLDK